MTENSYDLIVVGGGAAGLAGAKIAARSLRSVLLIDAGAPRNAPADGVHNYLYAEGTAPANLARIGRAEATTYGVKILEAPAESARVLPDPAPGAPRFEVTVGSRRVLARRLLLATGTQDILPEVPGLAEGWGRDVLHCPFCHGWEARGQAIGVLGSGPMTMHQAGLWGALSDDVTVVWANEPGPEPEQRDQLAALGIRLVVGQAAQALRTDGRLTGLRMNDGEVVPLDALAVATSVHARTDLLTDLGLDLADLEVMGTVLGTQLPVDAMGLTAVPGVWAAGNLTNPMLQVSSSAAAGAMAGSMAHVDLLAEDTQIAVESYRLSASE